VQTMSGNSQEYIDAVSAGPARFYRTVLVP
jgi:hypothetical protein